MYEKNGQTLEIIAKHFILSKFIRPKIRPYKTDNYYAAIIRQYKVNEEVEKLVSKHEKLVSKKRKKL